MKTTLFTLMLVLTGFLSACSSKNGEINIAADSTFAEATSGSLSKTGKNKLNRQFVRTADLKFRVKDVANATTAIEQITQHLGGFVTLTDLQSSIGQHTVTEVSPDSSLERTHYTISNTMILRVPTVRLDTTLQAIASLIDYLDHRTLKADDVALQVFSNDLTQQRASRRVGSVSRAEPYQIIIDGQQQADEARVSNLALQDQLEFSTVSLLMYEREKISNVLLPSNKEITSYQPSFLREVLSAIVVGWNLLKVLILSLIKLWSLALIAGIGWLLYKRVGSLKISKEINTMTNQKG